MSQGPYAQGPDHEGTNCQLQMAYLTHYVIAIHKSIGIKNVQELTMRLQTRKCNASFAHWIFKDKTEICAPQG